MKPEEKKVWDDYLALVKSCQVFSDSSMDVGKTISNDEAREDILDLVRLNKMTAYTDIIVTSLEKIGKILEKVIPCPLP